MDSCKQCDTSADLPFDIQRSGKGVQEFYRKMVQDGVHPRMAEMFALQQPPGVKGSDRAFMENRYNNQQLDLMPKHQAQRIVAEAKAAGVSPSGKVYCSGLADGRGHRDPAAWVDGAGDVLRVARERNLTVEGAVEHKGRPMPRPESKPLSESATRELMREERRRHPTMKKGELREYVIDRYGRKPKK